MRRGRGGYPQEHARHGDEAAATRGDRYDAFLWLDETRALRPLHPMRIDTREPETYPSGV